MRLTGTVQEATGFGRHDHLSWPYEDRGEYRRQVTQFLAEGLALGLRVVYLGDGPISSLKADLAGLPGLDEALSSGALLINALGDLYESGEPVDPDQTLATFAAATDEALALGYNGLRSAGDATSLLRTPEQVAAFAAWEATADRYMIDRPFSAMCSFDRTQLPARAAVSLVCMHPAALEGASLFRLYAPDTGADLGLAGELDISTAAHFADALELTAVDATDEILVDAEGLDFVDHRALQHLHDFAARLGATAVLRTRSNLPGRLVGLLGLDRIRIEPLPGLAVGT